MKFGISNNIKSRVVRECTPELFHQAMRSELVAEVCAEIADGKERCLRGELTKEEKKEIGNYTKNILLEQLKENA